MKKFLILLALASMPSLAQTRLVAVKPCKDGTQVVVHDVRLLNQYQSNQYQKCVNGKWVDDDERYIDEINKIVATQKHQEDLLWALKTRVLTDAELQEVRTIGTDLIIPIFTYTIYKDKEAEFNKLLLNQFYMRLAKEQANTNCITIVPTPVFPPSSISAPPVAY
jgi:hypothetical protein